MRSGPSCGMSANLLASALSPHRRAELCEPRKRRALTNRCLYSDCTTEVARKRHGGRPPRFCPEHSKPKYRKRAQRERDAQPRAPRPQCCQEAGRRGGRLACEQHKDFYALDGLDGIGSGALAGDYAGEAPRPARALPEIVGHPEDLPEVEGVMRDTPEGYIRADALDKGVESEGRRVCSPKSDFKILTRQSMTERYGYGPLMGSFIRVIGQPDLTADWGPSSHKDARPVEGLVPRGPDWPWAEEPEAPRMAA